MTEPNFRALCAELVEAWDNTSDFDYNDFGNAVADIVIRARAALARPEPQGPTNAELKATMLQAIKDFPPSHPDAKPLSEFKYELELEYRKARAVLQRWGRPAIEPVPVSERLPGPEDCDAEGRCWVFDDMLGLPSWTLIKVLGKNLEPDMTWLPHWALPVPGVDGADA